MGELTLATCRMEWRVRLGSPRVTECRTSGIKPKGEELYSVDRQVDSADRQVDSVVTKNVLRRAIRRSKSGSLIHSAMRPLANFIAFLSWPSGSSRSESLGDPTLHRGITQRSADCSFLSRT
uniref:Uncharacterized protein n=1 Tax=Solanum tuberosum TaxID=4113 RepID=M1DYU4_SOLTU